MDHVKKSYAIDERRVAIRGFSMGGAGAWHLAAHHPDVWAAAAPGAGFAETAEYTKVGTNRAKFPAWEQKLWQLYDATDYAANFANLPVVAYNGTDDVQRQAADVMEHAMKAAGLVLPRVWGTNIGHKYTPEAKAEVNQFVDEAVARGRPELPDKVHFTTRTLRYNKGPGLELLGLKEHWKPAMVRLDRSAKTISTTNVESFLLALRDERSFHIDGRQLSMPRGKPQQVLFERDTRGHWKARVAPASLGGSLRKRPGLQGPIDDAFMDSFLIVRPTGRLTHPIAENWITNQLAKATNDWRAQFRGDARVKDDVHVTSSDIENHNLILFGTLRFSRETELPVMIFPNPLNPRRYVVVNSGFTFAPAGAGSNAQQTPKLPDYAVLDLEQGGAVTHAGFFNEQWQLK
jgi:hypothetical protein